MAATSEPTADKAERDDAGTAQEENETHPPKRAKLAVAEPLMSMENGESASEYESTNNLSSDTEYEYNSESDNDDEIDDRDKKRKHPAEVEAEAFNEALDGISARVRFVSVSRRNIYIYIQPWRLFAGLSDNTVAALGLVRTKGVMVMLTTDQHYTMSSKPPQVRWSKQVEPALADANGDPVDESIGESLPQAWTISERLGEELSRTWIRRYGVGGTAPTSTSAESASIPGYLQLQREYNGGSDSEIARRADLKKNSATNLLVRLALTTIDRLRNAAEDCFVCGDPVTGDVFAAPTACFKNRAVACQKPFCQVRCGSLLPTKQRVESLSKLIEVHAELERQQEDHVITADDKIEFQVANDGETVRFLIDVFRRGMGGTRPELGLPEHLLEPRLLAPGTTGNNVENVRLLLRKLPSVEEMQRCIMTGGEKGSPESMADGGMGGVSSPVPPRAEIPMTDDVFAAKAAVDAIAAVSAANPRVAADAVPGAARSNIGDPAVANGGGGSAVKGAGEARDSSEVTSTAALGRTFPAVYPLLEWLLSNDLGRLKPLKEFDFRGVSCDKKFIVTGTGEREARFQAMKREAAAVEGSSGSFFAFHGSAPGNWHGILRLGLKNLSDSNYMSNGSSMGKGVYMANDLSRSLMYSQWGARIAAWRATSRAAAAGVATFRAAAAAAAGAAGAAAGRASVARPDAVNPGSVPASSAFAVDAGPNGAAAAAAARAANFVSVAAGGSGVKRIVDGVEQTVSGPPPVIVAICEVVDRPAYRKKDRTHFVVPDEECLAIRFLLVNPTLAGGLGAPVLASSLDLAQRTPDT